MENFFATTVGDVRQERSFFLVVSLTDPVKSKQSGFTDHELNTISKLAPEKTETQKFLKEYVSVHFFKLYFLFINWLMLI